MLYKSLISKTGLKCNYLVDFFATSLMTTLAYTHAYCHALLKLGVKFDLMIDHFM